MFSWLKDKLGTEEPLSPEEAASPQSSDAAQGSGVSPHTHREASLPAPRRMKIYTVELALRGISVRVVGTAESEWHACSSIMRRWPDARFVAVWEGQ